MKNILLVIDCLGPGGAQNQLSLLALGLQDRGYNVMVFTYFDLNFFKYKLDDKAIPVIHIPKKGKLGWNVISRLTKIIDEKNIDSIISYLHTPNLYATIARSRAKRNPKLIISYRSHTIFKDLGKLTLIARKYVNTKADHIVANSYHERDKWIAKFPELRGKFSTIYNCVDFNKYYRKSNINRSNDFLVVGTVSPAKNGLLVVDAMKILKTKIQDLRLSWVGKRLYNIPKRKVYVLRIERMLEKYGLQSNWIWKDATRDLQNEYHSHKVLILASTVEGLPNVVCEALMCGLPVIISNVLDHALMVREGVNGFLFDPNSADELAIAMLKFDNLTDEERLKMSDESHRIGKELFSVERMINKYIEVIN